MSGNEMMQAFLYVREVYANVSRMLQSADPVMSERGLSPYASWDAVWPSRPKVGDFETWMPTFVIRQYHAAGKKERDLVTIGAVLWSWPSDPNQQRALVQPLCIASRMAVTAPPGNVPDEVYRFGVAQRWARAAPADRNVHVLEAKDIAFDNSSRALFEKIVVDAKLVTIAAPLLSITTTEELESRLIKPVLSAG